MSPISSTGRRTPILRKSVPNSSVAKLCRKNSRPPVAKSWLIGARIEDRRDDEEVNDYAERGHADDRQQASERQRQPYWA